MTAFVAQGEPSLDARDLLFCTNESTMPPGTLSARSDTVGPKRYRDGHKTHAADGGTMGRSGQGRTAVQSVACHLAPRQVGLEPATTEAQDRQCCFARSTLCKLRRSAGLWSLDVPLRSPRISKSILALQRRKSKLKASTGSKVTQPRAQSVSPKLLGSSPSSSCLAQLLVLMLLEFSFALQGPLVYLLPWPQKMIGKAWRGLARTGSLTGMEWFRVG